MIRDQNAAHHRYHQRDRQERLGWQTRWPGRRWSQGSAGNSGHDVVMQSRARLGGAPNGIGVPAHASLEIVL